MKTKRGGRELNPTDAARKQARKREIKRNKAERTYIRDAFGKAQNTSKLGELKAELEELIKIEQTGELNKLQKLRKRVVLEAYEVAVRKKKVKQHIVLLLGGHGSRNMPLLLTEQQQRERSLHDAQCLAEQQTCHQHADLEVVTHLSCRKRRSGRSRQQRRASSCRMGACPACRCPSRPHSRQDQSQGCRRHPCSRHCQQALAQRVSFLCTQLVPDAAVLALRTSGRSSSRHTASVCWQHAGRRTPSKLQLLL